MTGGILQLVTAGVETLYLTGDPQITMFKLVYRRHTNFSINDNLSKIKSIKRFGDNAMYKLQRLGDCIHKLYLVFDIPDILLRFEDPTIGRIASILSQYGITWNYVGDGLTEREFITEEIYDTNVKPLVYDRIKELVDIYNLNVEHLKDTKTSYTAISSESTTLNTTVTTAMTNCQSYVTTLGADLTTLLTTVATIDPEPTDLETSITNIKTNISNATDNDITYYLSNIKTILTTTNEIPESLNARTSIVNAMLLAIKNDVHALPLSDSGAIEADLSDIEDLFTELEASFEFILDALSTANTLMNTPQQRRLSANNDFITYLFPYLVDNLPSSDTLTKTKILYEGLKTYRTDIANYDPDINNKVYNADDIKNIMYNKYLNLIVKSFPSAGDYTYTTSGITDIFDPNAESGDENFTRLYDNVIFYHVLEFGKYKILPDLVGVPTRQYFDKVLSDGYVNSSGGTAYTALDGYKIYNDYITNLSYTFQILDSTNNLILVEQNLLENILWNIRRNYQQMNNILNFLESTNYGDDSHYRIGYYKKYNQLGSLVVGTNSVFNSLFESKVPELNDNMFSVIKLSQLSGEPLTTIKQFFTNEIIKQMRTTVVSIQDEIGTITYEDYFNNFDLWKRTVIDNEPMKSIMDNSVTALYNQSVNFYTYFAPFGDPGKKRMSVMNYVPVLAIRDIPSMLYDLLNETTIELTNGGTNTSEELTAFMRDYFDYRDVDQRGMDPGATGADDFKKDLYSDVLEAVVFYYTGSEYVLVDEEYLETVATTYASTSSEYVTIPVFRPEVTMTVGVDFVKVLPIKAIVERFRIEFKSIINDFITAHTIDNVDDAGYDVIADVLDSVVDSFIKESIPDYSTYVNNGYSFYKIDTAITTSTVTTPRYCDAMSSIWYKINKNMVRSYNNLMNDYLLSRVYYTNELGPTMLENFTKFKNIATGAPYSVEYYDDDNPFTSDVYSSSDQPVSGEGFDFYLLRPTSNEPYATIKINVTHMITHFEKDYTQYNTLKNILNIKTIVVNKRQHQYDAVTTITNDISTTVLPYAAATGNPTKATSIINTTKTYVNANYKGVMDVIFGSYTPILEKSIVGIITLGMTGSNPYTSTKNITTSLSLNRLSNLHEWWTAYESFPGYEDYFIGSPNLSDLLSSILDPVDAIILFTDRNVKTLYNNYETRSDVLNYVMNKVIESTEVKFITNMLTTSTLLSVKKAIVTYLTTKITASDDAIKYLGVVGDTEIADDYDYPLYVYDNPNTGADDADGPFNITFDNSPFDVQITKYVNNEQPEFAWAKELGHRIIDYISVEVDGIVYDEYTSDLLHLDYELRKDTSHERGYNIMIGNTEDMYTINSESKPGRRLYVPINFWFCKDIGNSLPMVNILYSDVIINIRTKHIDDILYRDVGSRFIKKPKLGAHLLTQYIYLDDDERQTIAKSKMEFLIERYRYGGKHSYEFKDFVEGVISTQLDFQDPSKYLLWTSRIKTKTDSPKDKIDWMYRGYRTRDDGRLTVKHRSVDQLKIKFNGRDREPYKEIGYYNALHPYTRDMGSLEFGEYLYSFALYPLLLQPSGSANLSQVADLSILDMYDDSAITDVENNNLLIEKEYWSRTYQIIRIMSGIMAPAFVY